MKAYNYSRLFLYTTLIILSISCKEPVKVGIFHSLTGTMAISGRSMVDATNFGIMEINEAGGILGRPVQAIVLDDESNPETYARKAEELILKEGVHVIFGCWTSACRRAVKPVVERHNVLLMYPLQYEGLESSENILYTGAVPNQQITPAVKYFLENQGKKIYLVGSDYVFPRMVNQIIHELAEIQGGRICGETYIALGSGDFDRIIRDIIAKKPDVIFNTINGDSNKYFFEKYHKAGLHPDSMPVVSFSIAEDELRQMSLPAMKGHYAVWNYFESLDSSENKAFVRSFKNTYGLDRVVDDPMESAYISVKLWANAVNESGYIETDRVRAALRKQSLKTPGGIISVEYENLHLWKPVYIGRINSQNQFDIVWSSQGLVRPVPYPSHRMKSEWKTMMEEWQ